MVERKIEYFGEYFSRFEASLPNHTRKQLKKELIYLKIIDKLSSDWVKHIRDGVYELRFMSCGNSYRVFFIFEANRIVILFHGFQKKKRKTPKEEIDKALLLKEKYYEQRGRQNS